MGMLLVSFLLILFLSNCKKEASPIQSDTRLVKLTESSAFKKFEEKYAGYLEGIDFKSVRFVNLDKDLSSIHIPVIRNNQIVAAIIALPLDFKGNYELVFQDNSAVQKGTGIIYQYTSSNYVRRLDIANNKIMSVEGGRAPRRTNGGLMNPNDEFLPPLDDGCGFWCRLDKCYNETKSQFPGDTMCSVLDIFMGVCTSATVVSCLVKMANGQY